MDKPLNLRQKLVAIRQSVEYIQKTEKGNQGAMYADPAVILQKIRSGMDKQGVLLIPEVVRAKIVVEDAPTAKNPQNKGYLSENDMSYKWVDVETGDELTVKWFATGNHLQDPAMAFGGALTYAERYFLLKFFQIPTSKDDPEYFAQKTAVVEYITNDQGAKITDLLVRTKTEVAAFCSTYKISKISEIPSQYYPQVVAVLEGKLSLIGGKNDKKN